MSRRELITDQPCPLSGKPDVELRLVGTALVTGRAAIEAEINGQPRGLRLVFLNAWTKTPKGWKFIAWQSTPQPIS